MNCLFALLLAGLGLGCQAPALQRYEAQRNAMGTQFRLIFYAATPRIARQAEEASWARLEDLEDHLSDFRPASELSQLSRSDSAWMDCSNDLWRVLLAARVMGESSTGAFEISVGPLVKLWRRAMRQAVLPEHAQLAAALQLVGPEHLELDEDGQRARCLPGGVRLDLGGIAKGDALDQLLLVLGEFGIHSALVDGGGDVAVGAAPPAREGWEVGLGSSTEHPASVTLVHQALATSGATYRFIELDGVRYSHVVDPRSGLGVIGLAEVSVLAENGITADAAATALSVLGKERGLSWIQERTDLEACWWDRENPDALPCTSSGFPLRLEPW